MHAHIRSLWIQGHGCRVFPCPGRGRAKLDVLAAVPASFVHVHEFRVPNQYVCALTRDTSLQLDIHTSCRLLVALCYKGTACRAMQLETLLRRHVAVGAEEVFASLPSRRTVSSRKSRSSGHIAHNSRHVPHCEMPVLQAQPLTGLVAAAVLANTWVKRM